MEKMEKFNHMKHLMIITALLAFLLSSCGGQAGPTIDSAQVQASAAAAAGTMIALTQAAIPATPIPTGTLAPSPTALLSPTALTLPTLASFPTAAAPTAASSGGSACSGPMSTQGGEHSKAPNVRLANFTKDLVTISLNLIKNKWGDCGYKSYVINPMQSVFLASILPFGCYYSYAFSQNPKHPFHVSSGPDCITGVDKTTFNINETFLKVTGP
jgi:hypothetical protein